MRTLIGLVVLVVVSCSGSEDGGGGSSRITEVQAEEICRRYCDNERMLPCSSTTGASCLDGCMNEHRSTCGEFYTARKECELGLDCNDQFNDCALWDDRAGECIRDSQLRDRCMTLCPENFDSCYASDGDCVAGTGLDKLCTVEQVPEGGFLAREAYPQTSSECSTGVCIVAGLQGDPSNLQEDNCPLGEETCVPRSEVERKVRCSCQCRAPTGSGIQTCACPYGFSCQDTGPDVGYCVRQPFDFP